MSLRSWMLPADPAVTTLENRHSSLSYLREEMTCLWFAPYLFRFLKSPVRHSCIIGAPGTGKTVLASVIVNHLQHPIGGVSYHALFIRIGKYSLFLDVYKP
jgi:SpoVK/Ycf46/Vps4 family AAA+-type ATPase